MPHLKRGEEKEKNKMQETQKGRRLVRHLPRWFSLAKYRSADGLDVAAWYLQITVRQVCFAGLRDMRRPEPIFPERKRVIQQALLNLRENPICDPNLSPFDDAAFSFCYKFEFPTVPVVRSLTLEDLYLIDREARRNLTQDQISEAQEIASDHSLESDLRFFFPEWMQAKVREECCCPGEIPVMIDLGFPNSVIKSHFAIHLQNLRSDRRGEQGEARMQSPDLSEWAKAGVLQCMDLLLWAEEDEVRVTDRVIADALGPERGIDEEKIRKTIRPLSAGLLKGDTDALVDLRRLRALAHADHIQRLQARDRRNKRKIVS